MGGLEQFAAGALAGGLDTYGQIQTEQRKFKIDEMKAQANANREMNMRRAMKGMEASGYQTADGMDVAKEDLAGMDKSALVSPNQAESAKVERAHAFQGSGMVDKTGKELTYGELKALGGNTEGLTSKDQWDFRQQQQIQGAGFAHSERMQKEAETRQNTRADKKEAENELKADAKVKAATEAELKARRTGLLTQTTKIAEEYRKDPGAFQVGEETPSLKTVQTSTLVNGLMEQSKVLPAEMYSKMVADSPDLVKAHSIGKLATLTTAKGARLTPGEVHAAVGKDNASLYDDALDFMKSNNQLGTKKVGGFLGFGQTDQEVIRR